MTEAQEIHSKAESITTKSHLLQQNHHPGLKGVWQQIHLEDD